MKQTALGGKAHGDDYVCDAGKAVWGACEKRKGLGFVCSLVKACVFYICIYTCMYMHI